MSEATALRTAGGPPNADATVPIHPQQHNKSSPTHNRSENKQSFDYIIRSGIAGGIAGSAVCSQPTPPPLLTTNFLSQTGQNPDSSPRPCENPLPGLFPGLHKVHGYPLRRAPCHLHHPEILWLCRPLPWPQRNASANLPLRRRQVCGVRAVPRTTDKVSRARDCVAAFGRWRRCRHRQRVCHLPARGHTRATGVRNEGGGEKFAEGYCQETLAGRRRSEWWRWWWYRRILSWFWTYGSWYATVRWNVIPYS